MENFDTLPANKIKKGDLVTIEKWLKMIGHCVIEKNGRPRNVLAVCQKGKFVVAMACKPEEAETIVNDGGKLTPFKKALLSTKVKFDETIVNIFPKDVWKKMTTKNLFLGMLDEYRKKQEEKSKED